MAEQTIAATVWPYIDRSVERLLDVLEALPAGLRAAAPQVPGGNSVATLAGHVISNAEDNLLGTLCGIGGEYDRERDFEAPEADATAQRERWAGVSGRFEASLGTLDDAVLRGEFPHPRRGAVSGLEVMLVVARHAAEHLAHAELTRDLLLAARREVTT